MQPLTVRDLLSRREYEDRREEIRRRIMIEKGRRRVPVGDHCVVHFENRETMRYQVHEMLRAEGSWDRPGAVEGELAAYNPIIPGTGELSATIMFEYETAAERAEFLPKLVGVDRHVWLRIGEKEPILADLDRGQIDENKVSSVQYAKWRIDADRRRLLKEDGCVVRVVIDHPHYQGRAVLSEESRKAILNDPD